VTQPQQTALTSIGERFRSSAKCRGFPRSRLREPSPAASRQSGRQSRSKNARALLFPLHALAHLRGDAQDFHWRDSERRHGRGSDGPRRRRTVLGLAGSPVRCASMCNAFSSAGEFCMQCSEGHAAETPSSGCAAPRLLRPFGTASSSAPAKLPPGPFGARRCLRPRCSPKGHGPGQRPSSRR